MPSGPSMRSPGRRGRAAEKSSTAIVTRPKLMLPDQTPCATGPLCSGSGSVTRRTLRRASAGRASEPRRSRGMALALQRLQAALERAREVGRVRLRRLLAQELEALALRLRLDVLEHALAVVVAQRLRLE